MAEKALGAAVRAPRKGTEELELEQRLAQEQLFLSAVERELQELLLRHGPDPDKIVALLQDRAPWERRRAAARIARDYGEETADVLVRCAANHGIYDEANPVITKMREASRSGRKGHGKLLAERARKRVEGQGTPLPEELKAQARPLPDSVRKSIERATGESASDVRILVGPEAGQAAREVAANALTTDGTIMMDEARFQPDTPAGKRLLVHEAIHALQQRGGSETAGLAGPAAEREAEQIARQVAFPHLHAQGVRPVGVVLGRQQVALDTPVGDSQTSQAGTTSTSLLFNLNGATVTVKVDTPSHGDDQAGGSGSGSVASTVQLDTSKLQPLLPEGITFSQASVSINVANNRLTGGFQVGGQYAGKAPYLKPTTFQFTCDNTGNLSAQLQIDMEIPGFATAKSDNIVIKKDGITGDIRLDSSKFTLPGGTQVEGALTAHIKNNSLTGIDGDAALVLPQGFGKAKITCTVAGDTLTKADADVEANIPGLGAVKGKLTWDQAAGFQLPPPGLSVPVSAVPGLKGNVALSYVSAGGGKFSIDPKDMKFTSPILENVTFDKIDIDQAGLHTTVKLGGVTLKVPGWVELSGIKGSIQLDGTTLTCNDVGGNFDFQPIKTGGSFTMSYKSGELDIDAKISKLDLAPGILSLDGTPSFKLDLEGKGSKADLSGGFNIKLGKLGTGKITGISLSGGFLEGKGSVTVDAGPLKGMKVDIDLMTASPYLKATATVTNLKLALPSAGNFPIEATLQHAEIGFTGALDGLTGSGHGVVKVGTLADGTFTIALDKDGNVTGELKLEIKLPWAKGTNVTLNLDKDGKLSAKGSSTIPLSDPLGGDVQVNFDSSKGLVLSAKEVTYDLHGFAHAVGKDLKVDESGLSGDFKITPNEIHLPKGITITGELNAHMTQNKLTGVDGSAKFVLPSGLGEAEVKAQVVDGQISIINGQANSKKIPGLKSFDVKFSWTPGGGFKVEPIETEVDIPLLSGHVSVDLGIGTTGQMSATATDVEFKKPPAFKPVKFTKLTVSQSGLSGEASLNGVNLSVPGVTVSNVHGHVKLDGTKVSGDNIGGDVAVGGQVKGNFKADLSDSGELKAQGQITEFNIAKQILTVQGPLKFDFDIGGGKAPEGSLSGSVAIKLGSFAQGVLQNLKLAQGHVTGDGKVPFTSGPLKGLNVDVHLNAGSPYLTAKATANGMKLQLAQGKMPIDATVTSLDVNFNSSLTGLTGHADGTVSVGNIAKGKFSVIIDEDGSVHGTMDIALTLKWLSGPGNITLTLNKDGSITAKGDAVIPLHDPLGGNVTVKYDSSGFELSAKQVTYTLHGLGKIVGTNVKVDENGISGDFKLDPNQINLPAGLKLDGDLTAHMKNSQLTGVDGKAKFILPNKLGEADVSAKVAGGQITQLEGELKSKKLPGLKSFDAKIHWTPGGGIKVDPIKADVDIPALSGSVTVDLGIGTGGHPSVTGNDIQIKQPEVLKPVKFNHITLDDKGLQGTATLNGVHFDVSSVKVSNLQGSITLADGHLSAQGVSGQIDVGTQASGKFNADLTADGKFTAHGQIDKLNFAQKILKLNGPLKFDFDLGKGSGPEGSIQGSIQVNLGKWADGQITNLALKDGHFSGSGNIPFKSGPLAGVNAKLDLLPNQPWLKVEVSVSNKPLKLPISGPVPVTAMITKADIQLAADGSGLSGTVDGTVDVDGGKLAKGTFKLNLTPAGDFDGDITVSVTPPANYLKVTKAECKLHLHNETLSGSASATLTFDKYIKGDIKVGYDSAKGFSVEGKGLTLDTSSLPFTVQPFDASYANGQVTVPKITGTLKSGAVPGVTSATVEGSFVDGKLSLGVKDVKFTLDKLKGDVSASWSDGKWTVSGSATLELGGGVSVKATFGANNGGDKLNFDCDLQVDLNDVKKLIPGCEVTSGQVVLHYGDGKLSLKSGQLGVNIGNGAIVANVNLTLNDDQTFSGTGDATFNVKWLKGNSKLTLKIDHNKLSEVDLTGLEIDIPMGKATLAGKAKFDAGGINATLQVTVSDIPLVESGSGSVTITGGKVTAFSATGKFKNIPGLPLQNVALTGGMQNDAPTFGASGDIQIPGLKSPLHFDFTDGGGKWEAKVAGSIDIPGVGTATVSIDVQSEGGWRADLTIQPNNTKIVKSASGWIAGGNGPVTFGGQLDLNIAPGIEGSVSFQKLGDGDFEFSGTITPTNAVIGGQKKSLFHPSLPGLHIPIPLLTVGIADVHAGLDLGADLDLGIYMPSLALLPITVSGKLSQLEGGQLPDVQLQAQFSAGAYASATIHAGVFIGLGLLGASLDLQGEGYGTLGMDARVNLTVTLEKQGDTYVAKGALGTPISGNLSVGVALKLILSFLGKNLWDTTLASKEWPLGGFKMGDTPLKEISYTLGKDSTPDQGSLTPPLDLGQIANAGINVIKEDADSAIQHAKDLVEEAKRVAEEVVEAPVHAAEWAGGKIADGASSAWHAVSSW